MWKDSETEIDYLDYEHIVEILVDIVCNDNLLPLVLEFTVTGEAENPA